MLQMIRYSGEFALLKSYLSLMICSYLNSQLSLVYRFEKHKFTCKDHYHTNGGSSWSGPYRPIKWFGLGIATMVNMGNLDSEAEDDDGGVFQMETLQECVEVL